MTVGEWLQSLGLSQYEALFRERQIEMDVLPDLTEADLKGLGVALGSRKRLMKAIADLESADPSRGTSGSKAAAATAVDAVARRPLSILFCAFESSTPAAQFDVEEWRDILAPYADKASQAVMSFGGRVLPSLSDGLMVAFGYQQTEENDAERAVRAALAIQRAAGELNASASPIAPKLLARIGIESGKLVIDSMGGVFGMATSVAARVQAEADPGSVLVTANVQRQVAGVFIAEDKGDHTLKGVPHAVHLYRIERVVSGRRRTGPRTLTPFAGREKELELLLRSWELARSGEGQFVLIDGDPGIGKSRLLREFQVGVGEAPHTWIDWSASQLLQNTPLHPAAEWARSRFGASKAQTDRLADLESVLTQVGLDAQAVSPLVAPLLEIPLPPNRVSTHPLDELRRLQLATLESWILAGARRLQPMILAFEDLQWSDPTSLDLLTNLADSGAQAPLLIVATARPEFIPPWRARAHHARIALAPLDQSSVRQMVGALASQRVISEEIVDVVNERTGGVPLFVEEVTRLLLERGEEIGVQGIPPTIQQSLAARLDRLGPAREIAEIGAVLGREFSYALLRDVSGLPGTALQASLDRLVEAGILYADGAPPEASYRFKHALVQDEAHENLLTSHRQALHLRAAEVLRESGNGRASLEPEAIARHFAEAGRRDLAIEWWGNAGDQALRRSAFREAISHLGKAIELADAPTRESGQSHSAEEANRSLKLHSDYAQAVMWSRGFAAEEAKVAFARVHDLTAQTGDIVERFNEYNGRWLRSYVKAELRTARETAETFLREAERAGRPMEAGAARRILGLTCLFQGEFAKARSHFERTLSNYTPERDRESRFRFNVETGACAAGYLALACWHLGDVARAGPLVDSAVSQAFELGHVPTIVNVHTFKAILDARRGRRDEALRAIEVQVRLGREHGMSLYVAFGEMFAIWARSRVSGGEGAANVFQPMLATYMSEGNRVGAPYFHYLLGELECQSGEAASALKRIEEGLQIADETDEHWSDPELYRLRGEILGAQDPKCGRAEEAFVTAIAVARRQESRSFALRAALALAELRHASGRPSGALAVLNGALEGLPPTPEMPEFARAEALVVALNEVCVH
jgi:class 3 adenylate cyclase/tetratricopeptide (TPR) repeat protein